VAGDHKFLSKEVYTNFGSFRILFTLTQNLVKVVAFSYCLFIVVNKS